MRHSGWMSCGRKKETHLQALGQRAKAAYFQYCQQRELSQQERQLQKALTDLGLSVSVLRKLDDAQVNGTTLQRRLLHLT